MEKTTQNNPNHDEIARLAYLAWEKAGKPANQELELWLKAEQQVLTSNKPAAQRPITPAKPQPRPAAAKPALRA